MRRSLQIHGTLLMILLLAGCSTLVNVDYDQQFDFKTLHSYTLKRAADNQSDDPLLDNPLMQKRFITAIDTQLQARGYQKAAGHDFRVEYRVDVKQEIESDSSGVSFGIGFLGSHSAVGISHKFGGGDVQSYDMAVLTIDVLAGSDDHLIWRGSHSRRVIEGMTPERAQLWVNELVGEILEEFPPR